MPADQGRVRLHQIGHGRSYIGYGYGSRGPGARPRRWRGCLFGGTGGPALLLATVRSLLRLHSTERKLAERDAGLRRLVDANVVGIAIAGMEGIKDANDEYLRILGMTRRDLRNGRVDWRKTTPPEHLEHYLKGVEELRRRGTWTPFELDRIRADGGRVPVLIGAAALSAEPLEWICFVVDLSAQKRTEADLRARTEELAQPNENLQRFAYIVAHDLQTPLRTIASMIQLLAKRFEGGPIRKPGSWFVWSFQEWSGDNTSFRICWIMRKCRSTGAISLRPLMPLPWPRGPSPTSRRRSMKPMPP